MIGDDGCVLGTAILDLAKYAMKTKSQDRLPLIMSGGIDDNHSCIEVNVKATMS